MKNVRRDGEEGESHLNRPTFIIFYRFVLRSMIMFVAVRESYTNYVISVVKEGLEEIERS